MEVESSYPINQMLSTSHDPARGSDQEVFKFRAIGPGRVAPWPDPTREKRSDP